MANGTGIDVARLTIPIASVIGVLGAFAYAGFWLSNITTKLETVEKRLGGVETNTADLVNAKNDARFDLRLGQERQNNQADRINDLMSRMLKLEDWQRAVNDRNRPNP